jgi:hypothetical protein
LLLLLRCAHLVPVKAPLPEEAIFNRKKAAAERQRAARKAQHKEHDRNENRIKRRKAGERGISSNEDPSLEPSWSGDVAIATVDWSDMLGSSSSSPPRATKVSSSQQPQMAAHDKNAGSSSHLAARPTLEDQRVVRLWVAPNGACAPESQRAPPRQADRPRWSEERPALVRQLFDGSDRPDSDSLKDRLGDQRGGE